MTCKEQLIKDIRNIMYASVFEAIKEECTKQHTKSQTSCETKSLKCKLSVWKKNRTSKGSFESLLQVGNIYLIAAQEQSLRAQCAWTLHTRKDKNSFTFASPSHFASHIPCWKSWICQTFYLERHSWEMLPGITSSPPTCFFLFIFMRLTAKSF